MKHSLLILSAAAIISSCDHKGHIMPSPDQEEMVPMEFTMSTGISTKALVKGTRLPNPSSVGITVRDSDGAYTGEAYTNVQYTSRASIIIPSGVTYVGNYCFSDCSNLRHIVSLPVITPNLGGNYRYNFLGVATGGILAVPAAAKTGSNYSYWVTSNINLESYGWTLVYMAE